MDGIISLLRVLAFQHVVIKPTKWIPIFKGIIYLVVPFLLLRRKPFVPHIHSRSIIYSIIPFLLLWRKTDPVATHVSSIGVVDLVVALPTLRREANPVAAQVSSIGIVNFVVTPLVLDFVIDDLCKL